MAKLAPIGTVLKNVNEGTRCVPQAGRGLSTSGCVEPSGPRSNSLRKVSPSPHPPPFHRVSQQLPLGQGCPHCGTFGKEHWMVQQRTGAATGHDLQTSQPPLSTVVPRASLWAPCCAGGGTVPPSAPGWLASLPLFYTVRPLRTLYSHLLRCLPEPPAPSLASALLPTPHLMTEMLGSPLSLNINPFLCLPPF